MIIDLIVDAGGGEAAIILNTDDLMKMFGSRTKAVNINSITIYPLTFGAAVVYELFADYPIKVDESGGSATTVPAAEVGGHIFTVLQATGGFTQVARPAYKTFFRFTTNDVAPQTKGFSAWPIFTNLVLHWDADVDINIEFDFAVLEDNWNVRGQIMDLLAGKSQVEDPNLSNLQGKRAVRRASLPSLNE